MSRVPIALNLANIEDDGFLEFFNDLRRKSQLPKLIVDLLRFYYKDETVRANLQDFIVKEDEFLANITEQFSSIVEQHQKTGSAPVGLGAIPTDQLVGLMMNMGMAMQKNTQPPIYVQQVNPTAYPQGFMPEQQGYQQGYQQMPMQQQQVGAYQQLDYQTQQQVAPTVPQQAVPQQQDEIQQEEEPKQFIKHEEATPIKPVEQPVDNPAPMGLFADDDEEEADKPKKPASFQRFMKSIK